MQSLSFTNSIFSKTGSQGFRWIGGDLDGPGKGLFTLDRTICTQDDALSIKFGNLENPSSV